MNVHTPDRVVVIGRGRLGRALHDTFDRADIPVVNIRHDTKPQGIRQLTSCSIVFLAVPDDHILSTAEFVAGWSLPTNIKVVHCSGSHTISELQACVDVGCRTASIHPFQTIPEQAPTNVFFGVPFGVECSPQDIEWCHALVDILHGIYIQLPFNNPRAKSAYHAAAVACSSFIQACMTLAARACDVAGVEAAAVMPRITQTAIDNAFRAIVDREPMPFTGPVVRGDTSTIQRHVAALPEAESLAYTQFSAALSTLIGKE